MNTNTMNLIREAEKQAIWVSPISGLEVCKNGSTSTVYPVTSRRTFNYNSGVLSWTNPTGQYYIPCGIYNGLIAALKAEGYAEENFWIHLCNGGVPVGLEEHWNRLFAESERRSQICRVNALNELAHEFGIKPLPCYFISSNCFEVPLHGIEVKYAFVQKTEFIQPSYLTGPQGQNLSPTTFHSLGKFCQNNGIIAFYNEDGTYFVCDGTTENREVLYAHGYKEDSFFVMFSNGERPVDEFLKAELKKVLRR